MQKRTICEMDGCPNGNTFHKNTSIVELDDGEFMAAWFANQSKRQKDRSHEQSIFGSRYSGDSGTWSEAERLVDTPGRANGSPVFFHGPDDTLWLVAPQMYGNSIAASRLLFKRSDDQGRTWTDMEILHDKPGLYTKNKPLHLRSEDRWLLGVDILHGAEDSSGFLIIEDDFADRPGDFPLLVGGDQITPGSFVSASGMIYPTAIELSDGTILAYMRPRPGGYLWETRSFDGGYKWTEARQTDIPNPDAGFDVHRTDDGNVVLVINPVVGQFPEGRNELAVFMSEDDCETWPYQFYLEREPTTSEPRNGEQNNDEDRTWVGQPEFTYGYIIQSSDGRLHVTYEARTSQIIHVTMTEDEIRERSRDEPIVDALA